MEKIVSRGNMMVAYSRVMSNKGAAGVDNMPVTALKGYLQGEWSRIKEELLGELFSTTGTESRNTQTGRRDTDAGNSHCS